MCFNILKVFLRSGVLIHLDEERELRLTDQVRIYEHFKWNFFPHCQILYIVGILFNISLKPTKLIVYQANSSRDNQNNPSHGSKNP